jgi:NitT/TauT family transport system substrate-binding protein
MSVKRSVAAVLLGSALLGTMAWTAPARAADTPVKFSLDWSYQGYHAWFVQAADHGFFAKEGLAVTIDRGFGVTDTISKVASGTYDIGQADINSLVKFNAEHPERRVISVFQIYDKTPAAVMALKRSGIAKPKDLEGKTISTIEADVARLLFPAFARANQVDASKISWQTFAPNLRDAMVVSGKADAVTGYTITSIFNIVNAGVPRDDIVTLPFADLGLPLYGSGLLTTEAYARAHPEAIKGFIRATIKGLNATLADPKAAVAAVVKRDPLLNAQIELDRMQMTLDTVILTPYIKTHGFGSVDPERMAKVVAVNAEAYNIANPPKPEQIYTTQFLPAEAERMPQAK